MSEIITDAAQLERLCDRLREAPWIALDTEFMRVQTYRARLCLLQLATPQLVVCVDPLAPGMHLQPLLDVLYATDILKVLHAARQDLEVFADLAGAPPKPVFDTQIAAALVGYDDQIGYGTLVEKITGHKLAKMEARTDWAARPLSETQIAYAEDDVRYLRDVYLELARAVDALGRRTWLEQECAALVDPVLYGTDPAQAWRRLGAGASLPAREQTLLAALAAWRERQAQQRDLPRGWVVPDAALIEIARRAPDSLALLGEIPDLKPAIVRRYGEQLLDEIRRASALPARTTWEPAERLDNAQLDLLKRLTAHARAKAERARVSAPLLAPRRELMRLLRGDKDCALLRGWRRELVGQELLDLLPRQ